ncbi:MAG: hypothetical protein JJU00_01465 [Opitutales bacterium]|nr:hypothetical protein [Opitutales bacterium]
MAENSDPDPPRSRPPSGELEGLRAQRSLIAEHLAWLDERIAALERGDTSTANPPGAGETTAPRPAPAEISSPAKAPPVGRQAVADTVPDPLLKEFANSDRARAAGRQNARSIQAGCIIMGVIAVVAFLTLFFVIPYFIF